MGTASSQVVKENQSIITNVTQQSSLACRIGCSNNISDVTIIDIGGTGDINIKQTCQLTGVQCVMQQTLDTSIDSILSSIADQSVAVASPLIPSFNASNQYFDLKQSINNQITQIMDSSCDIQATNNIDNVYIYSEGTTGNINLTQDVIISNSTCNMSNLATAQASSAASSDTAQSFTKTSSMQMLMTLIIICIVFGGMITLFIAIIKASNPPSTNVNTGDGGSGGKKSKGGGSGGSMGSMGSGSGVSGSGVSGSSASNTMMSLANQGMAWCQNNPIQCKEIATTAASMA